MQRQIAAGEFKAKCLHLLDEVRQSRQGVHLQFHTGDRGGSHPLHLGRRHPARTHHLAVAIGKNCHKLQVPLPGRGYWAKKQHGHPVKRKPLPKVHEIRRIERYQRPIVPATVPTPQPAKPQFPVEGEDKADVAQIDQMLASGAFVVIKPRKALRHALIVSARNILRKGFAAKQILQAPWNETCLDIQVSKTALAVPSEFTLFLVTLFVILKRLPLSPVVYALRVGQPVVLI